MAATTKHYSSNTGEAEVLRVNMPSYSSVPAPMGAGTNAYSMTKSGEEPPPLQGAIHTQINLITSLWGPTAFALPWAFQEAGWLAGTIGIIFVAVASFYTLILLVRSKRMLVPSSKARTIEGVGPVPAEGLSYADIAAIALGPRASGLVKAATIISCLGACSAYMTFIAGMLDSLIPGVSQASIMICLTPLLVLLSWIRGFSRLASVSVLGVIGMLLGVSAMLYDGLTREVLPLPTTPTPTTAPPFAAIKPSTVLLFFGPCTFIYIIHYCALPIENEMLHPSAFDACLANVVAFTTLAEIAIGVSGYYFYGGDPLVRDPQGRVLQGCEHPVCDNVLKNISPGRLKTIMFCAFSVNLIFTYTVILTPPREYIEAALVKRHYRYLPMRYQQNLLRLGLVLLTLLVASSVHHFSLITGFVGSLTDSLQGFLLPPFIYLALNWQPLGPNGRAGMVALAGVGLIMMVASTVFNVQALIGLLRGT